MIVLDAGAIVALLLGDLEPERVNGDELAVPHLADSEVMNVVRRLVLQGSLTEDEGAAAVDGFLALGLERYPADGLRARMWELRHNCSAYDATYLALAEQTGARALLTTDARLTRAPNLGCPVELV